MSLIDIRDRMIRGDLFEWDEVTRWGSSDDIELMGAAYLVLTTTKPVLVGAADQAEAQIIVLQYLLAVLAGKASNAAVFQMQPYVAGHSLAAVYKELRMSEPDASMATLGMVRNQLASLYRDGDEVQKRIIVDGALEHIFEEPMCRSDFAEWSLDPTLGRAWKEAMEWVETQAPE